jgi:hypothetical protein
MAFVCRRLLSSSAPAQRRRRLRIIGEARGRRTSGRDNARGSARIDKKHDRKEFARNRSACSSAFSAAFSDTEFRLCRCLRAMRVPVF